MKKILLFILFAIVTADLMAQGFNSFSGRNHPELNWQVAETENFLIMYPQRLAGIEVEAAPIAEETYRALSENLEYEFEDKIRIYLSDEDEINNGFAVPIGKGYTNIWVNTNDYSEIWTGREKWLRKVLAHELGHIFHFGKVWSPMGMWQYVVGNPVPSFWTEGLAQYQTEKWDSQRGDRWLRKAIFDSRPSYSDGQSAENGALRYASGNSQLRYFTEKYGDSTLVELLGHRKKFMGLFDHHDFRSAFTDVVDGGYNSFYEEWRKHMNVYYNTVASQMERTDSLGVDPMSLPGQFYYDMAVSPDGSKIAVLSLTSLSRPVRRLFTVQNDSTRKIEFIAEGAINSDISWSTDGSVLFYSRLGRGKNSSLLNDIYGVSLETREKREIQLTDSRRAKYPIAGPDDATITYVVNESGTGNLFMKNIMNGFEERITDYEGDVQVLWPIWIESQNSWLIHRFDENGDRNLVLIERETKKETVIDSGDFDNRKAVLSPDESEIAYTSLRDEVPNVFIYNFEDQTERRHTNLFTGGDVYGWIVDDDSLSTEKLLVKASETKRMDAVYWVEAERTPFVTEISVPESYSSWRFKAPPEEIPSLIPSDEAPILNRYRYRSSKNITHAASIVLPYYADKNNYGLFATTNWTEPLGKHLISGLGWVSFTDPGEKSYGSINYINNQFYPSIGFSLYRLPGSLRFYGDDFLVENLTGGEITARWPLDQFEKSYQASSLGIRLRHVLVDPVDRLDFVDLPGLERPEKARQTDLQVSWQIVQRRPWRDNNIHPLDGGGVKVSVKGSEKVLGSDVRFLTGDFTAYTIVPSIGLHRVFAQIRLQAQLGDPLPQDFIGFSRFDNISFNLPNEVPVILFNEADRVRGYRSFVAGNRVMFASLEYRIPFFQSLNTNVLGLIGFGTTTLSLFTDGGIVLNPRGLNIPDDDTVESRWGSGAEIKNVLSLFGIQITHAVGVAQPTTLLFTDAETDLYYRVRAVVPF